MTYSERGLNLTKAFEGFILEAYQDQGGVWTIGYGHTRGVKAGDSITQLQADALLAGDVQEAVQAVHRLVHAPLSQNQFDALVDLQFNAGAITYRNPNGEPSGILQRLNAGDMEGAAREFQRWNKIGTVPNRGLTRRRLAEAQLFRS